MFVTTSLLAALACSRVAAPPPPAITRIAKAVPPPATAVVTADAGMPAIPMAYEPPLYAIPIAKIDEAVEQAIAEAKIPGCVVAIGRRDSVLVEKAYGDRQIQPFREPMTVDTLFDLASITKPMATAASLMVLVDRGLVSLDDLASKFVPELKNFGKADITIRQIMTHTAGLRADTPLDDAKLGRAEMVRRAIAAPLRAKPGERVLYSDVGYLLIQEIVERVSKTSLDRFAHDFLYAPLAMNETMFNPPAEFRVRAATTESRDGAWIRGVVHDPRAYYSGGVAGHAGLFSTAHDVGRFARAMLHGGELDGARVLTPHAVDTFFAPNDLPGAIRATGWDIQSAFSSNRGTMLSRRAVGHGGYTGTSIWIDPQYDLFVIVLSNRVHPDGKGAVNALAAKIADIAVSAIPSAKPTILKAVCDKEDVLTGIDVLERGKFDELRGAHVALLTNQTGRDKSGTRTIDLLRAADDIDLVSIWTPEHGVEGAVDDKVADSVDEATGVPVYSLYGARLSPNDDMLNGIDTVVVDLQDAGTRFFTYASTMHRAMKVVAPRGIHFMILDRPNPIDGVTIGGPVSSHAFASFVNHLDLPVRHGLTLGELAELANSDEHLGARLEVVRMIGYRRTASYDDTNLAWVNPSPNLRSVTEALLYPGIGLLEGGNISVGRGTETPFEIVGAPWVDAKALAHALGNDALLGASFSAIDFTPTSSSFANEVCHGVKITVTDRGHVDPIRIGVAIARELQLASPTTWKLDGIASSLANAKTLDAIRAGKNVNDIQATWSNDLAAFRAKREKYLLYAAGPCP
ncbi:MAG: exo-beta-N-acetylmuramidase NamZ domain-containing protein [Polyangiaceae bacterium]